MEWSTYLDKSISVYTLLSLELDDVEAESGSEISVLWEVKISFSISPETLVCVFAASFIRWGLLLGLIGSKAS